MKNQISSKLVQAIAVCCELTNTQLSTAAARVMADDLAQYPEHQVMAALTRCRRELRGSNSLTIADVIARLDDGRPGPEEAWAICAPCLGNEGPTVVRTEEMREAWAVAENHEDRVAARMAFLEAYRASCTAARANGEPVVWTPCLGQDKGGRDAPVLAAVEAGKLTADHAMALLPHIDAPDKRTQELLGMVNTTARLK